MDDAWRNGRIAINGLVSERGGGPYDVENAYARAESKKDSAAYGVRYSIIKRPGRVSMSHAAICLVYYMFFEMDICAVDPFQKHFCQPGTALQSSVRTWGDKKGSWRCLVITVKCDRPSRGAPGSSARLKHETYTCVL